MKRLLAPLFCVFSAMLVASPQFVRDRGNAEVWEVFSSLDEKERGELLRLQRNDPEKFRTEFDARAEIVYQRKKERYEKLQKLIDAYRNASDDAEKARIRLELSGELRAGFDRRLAEHRKHLEEMKRRAERMAADLERREKQRDKVVEAYTDALLDGKKELHVPRKAEAPPVFPQK